jgi:hypothetical protein
MAKSNPLLINALRETADRLSTGVKYEWGHMGRCNCGHLVQTITKMTDREIVEAVDNQLNEWTEHAREYCDTSNSKAEVLFDQLKEVGFDYEDVIKLEYLSDKKVLNKLGEGPVFLSNNKVEDVILYMDTMAGMLEEELV